MAAELGAWGAAGGEDYGGSRAIPGDSGKRETGGIETNYEH